VVPRKTRFRYKLEGHDSVWQDAETRRQAFYTDLAPGQYRFRVTASNNDGVWNETGTALDFLVEPAFFQTLWFRALSAVAAILVVMLLFLLRVKQVEGRLNARLEERLIERERIARDLHDTLLQSLQGLILRFQAVLKRIPESEGARGLMEQALE